MLTKEPALATQIQRSRVCPEMVAIKRGKVENKNQFERKKKMAVLCLRAAQREKEGKTQKGHLRAIWKI